jgi:DNA-binding NarL/FixJ family response regulator
MTKRVLLVDDHRLVREGLRNLLERDKTARVVGEAEDGRQAVSLAKKLKPDVVIMDVGMPGLNGVEATSQIREASPETKVLALSMHSDRRFIAQMLHRGASGYLLKDCAFEELAKAMETVGRGEVYLSPAVVDTVVEDYVQRFPAEGASAFSVLSPREREVLQLLAEGDTTKQIALKLHISPKTVETHRRQIMEKLQIFSVAELTLYAVREGLVKLDK